MVEGLGRRVWPPVIKFTHRHAAIPLQRTRPRGISLLRNTHKSTSLLKGSEIGKRALQRTSNRPPPLLRLLSLSDGSIRLFAPMSAHVCIRLRGSASRQLLLAWKASLRASYPPDIIGDPLHISNARDTSVSCGIREGKLSASTHPCFFF